MAQPLAYRKRSYVNIFIKSARDVYAGRGTINQTDAQDVGLIKEYVRYAKWDLAFDVSYNK